jgi:hypothetical protein
MKLIHLLTAASSLALGTALACDLEKQDAESGADEGSVEPDDVDEEADASSESSGGHESGEPGTSDTGEATSETGEVPPPSGEPYAFAMRYGDLPELEPGNSDSGGSDGEPFQDDDALVVTIATAAQTCDDPHAALPCGGNFSIGFILPPDIQAPGTYALWEEAFGTSTYAAPPYPEGDCAWGGGSLSGFVEIETIDAQHVVGRLYDTDAWDFDANLDFDAPICP